MRNFHRIVLGIVGVLCVIFVLVYGIENEKILGVYVLDIGQGDATYIRTPAGNDMLIDGGPSQRVLEELASVMPWYDRTIDVVLATHPDKDHIGGLPHVLERYRVGVYIEPGIESENMIDDEVRRILDEKNIETITARRGMRVNFGDGAYFDILYPDKDVSGLKDTNDASIVGRIQYGSTSIMFTGDASTRVEKNLVSVYGRALDSDILKVGHHGSNTSTDKSFVEVISPDVAVISVGKNNRYGHPKQAVLDTLEQFQVKTLRTDEEGTIMFVSDGKEFVKK